MVDVPCRSNTPDGFVLILRACAPEVRTIPADACREHILVVIGVGCIGKERHKAVVDVAQISEISCLQSIATHQSVGAVEHILVDQGKGEHIRVIVIECAVVIVDDRLAHFMPQECHNIVMVGISAVKVQLLTEGVGFRGLVGAIEDVAIGQI